MRNVCDTLDKALLDGALEKVVHNVNHLVHHHTHAREAV